MYKSENKEGFSKHSQYTDYLISKIVKTDSLGSFN